MGKLKQEQIKRLNNTRQQFLNTFFGDNGPEDKKLNGFWLVKHWNGNNDTWEVAIYTEDSYARKQEYHAEQDKLSLNWIN